MRINPICGASYERAAELMAAGCPIDYLDALPHQSFRVEQLSGNIACCVYVFSPIDAAWVIALRLATDRPSGTVISAWSFEPPWKDQDIRWHFDPVDVIPKWDLDVYKHLFKSRLTGVLNEGRMIRRGYPVEGILCGRSYRLIGESSGDFISAKSSFTDDLGNTVPLWIDLSIDRRCYLRAKRREEHLLKQRLESGEARQPLSKAFQPLTERINPVTGMLELVPLDQFGPEPIPGVPGPEPESLDDKTAT